MNSPTAADRYIPRALGPRVEELLDAFRVVIVGGPRQAGKSTLARHLVERRAGTYLSLDDPVTLDAAREDPRSFVSGHRPPLAIDEVQRGGDDLVRHIKMAVDTDPAPGRFLLLGSARFLTVPTLAESLAGRAVFADLWPLSQGEMERVHESFVDRLLDSPEAVRALRPIPLERSDYFARLTSGGFPEAQHLPPALRSTWCDAYVGTVVSRDVADFTDARKLHALPRLLRLAAARSSQLLVKADLARDAGVHHATLDEYLGYLETVYLVRTLPAWHRNPTSKRSKTPKIVIVDAGLGATLLEVDEQGLARPGSPAAGPLMETFVTAELLKQLGVSEVRAELSHLRDHRGREVDLVCESSDGRMAAIEVKTSATVRTEDFNTLRWLQERVGEAFVNGLVLYPGPHVAAFGPRLTAMPISTLWASPTEVL